MHCPPNYPFFFCVLALQIWECNFFFWTDTHHIPIFNPVDLLGKGTQTFTSPAIETTTLGSISTSSSTVSENIFKNNANFFREINFTKIFVKFISWKKFFIALFVFPFLAHCQQQTSEKFHILAKVETKNNLFEFPLATYQSKNSIQTQIHDCKTNNNHQTGHRIIDDEK